MSRTAPRALAMGIALALTLTCGTSLAYFTTIGTGATNAGISALSAPALAAPTQTTGGAVSLSWTASTAPGSEPVAYYVTRDGGAPAGTCAPATAPAAATSCLDREVPPGEHTYVVTATWAAWKSQSASRAINVAVGAATHLVVSAASVTPVAGVTDNLTISARDENESIVTT